MSFLGKIPYYSTWLILHEYGLKYSNCSFRSVEGLFIWSGLGSMFYMVPDLDIAWTLATDISCFIGRIVAAYQQIYWRQNVVSHLAKSCSILTSEPDEVRNKLKEVPICPQILISEQQHWCLQTSVIVRQTEIFISTARLQHRVDTIILSQPTRRRTSQKTVIELINQINTWKHILTHRNTYSHIATLL